MLLKVARGRGSAVGCRSIFCQMAIWCGSRSFVVIVGGGVVVGGAASIGIGPLGGVGHASVGWLVAMRGGGGVLGGFGSVGLQI